MTFTALTEQAHGLIIAETSANIFGHPGALCIPDAQIIQRTRRGTLIDIEGHRFLEVKGILHVAE